MSCSIIVAVTTSVSVYTFPFINHASKFQSEVKSKNSFHGSRQLFVSCVGFTRKFHSEREQADWKAGRCSILGIPIISHGLGVTPLSPFSTQDNPRSGMATAQLLNNIFLRAFKDCVRNIIKRLPASPIDDPTTSSAIQIIASQLNGDFLRLQYVIEVIQSRLSEDPAWASTTAVKVYELLAMLIDPKFSHPDTHMSAVKGAVLVRDQMVRACQSQFQQTMTEPEWSRGLIAFLGQLCTIGSISSTTPNITLHIIDCMMASSSLNTNNNNFDVFLGFMMRAGPFLDSHELPVQEQLTARMDHLKDRAKVMRTFEWLAVYGVLQLREKGWRVEEPKVETA